MTLRSIINQCSYKKVFNIIYKSYFAEKSYSHSKITEADLSYLKVYQTLKDLPICNLPELEIHLDEVKGDSEKYIHVSLYDPKEDQIYACDFCPWSDMIDCPITAHIELTDDEILAHIMWEMTFWGFSEKAIEDKAKSLNDDSEFIEFNLNEL